MRRFVCWLMGGHVPAWVGRVMILPGVADSSANNLEHWVECARCGKRLG